MTNTTTNQPTADDRMAANAAKVTPDNAHAYGEAIRDTTPDVWPFIDPTYGPGSDEMIAAAYADMAAAGVRIRARMGTYESDDVMTVATMNGVGSVWWVDYVTAGADYPGVNPYADAYAVRAGSGPAAYVVHVVPMVGDNAALSAAWAVAMDYAVRAIGREIGDNA